MERRALVRVMAVAAMAGSAVALAGAPGMATPGAQNVSVQALNELSGSGHGTVTRSVSASGVPLLARFQYHFTDGDHHIRQVSAIPLAQQSAVEIAFADENGDDNYSYRVSHEYVDPSGIVQASFHGNCAGECTRPLLSRPVGDVVFVLTGFRFTYDSADHHLDKIAVSENNSQLTTAFEDLNGDDAYTYDVSYAWVPRSRLGTVSSVQNTVHGVATSTNFAAAGEKVIRGFSMDNLGSGVAGDNHIRDLGVVANANSIDVTYGDINPADSADWGLQVQYATLL
ncbi:hypothetical protein ACFWP5_36200 [Streptomyces sp. NPDC058469]|uniref:hypothetical protein n=1 Tax=Streptomyces sp. NPDC058469 TaxID=3346514 RepID=UPI00365990A5